MTGKTFLFTCLLCKMENYGDILKKKKTTELYTAAGLSNTVLKKS